MDLKTLLQWIIDLDQLTRRQWVTTSFPCQRESGILPAKAGIWWLLVTPVKNGIQSGSRLSPENVWIPAFAGMTAQKLAVTWC
jgi:hypothetical protein